MIFKHSQYKVFLKNIITSGRISRFSDWRGDHVFLLRHDVDIDISCAHKLAVIEKEEGIHSTYFILPTSNSYNILNERNRKLLSEIKEMGYEIGLHFDTTLYNWGYEKN
jgi:hypothetical protein